MSSAKEPVTFELNSTWTQFITSFQFRIMIQVGLEQDKIMVNQMCNKASRWSQLFKKKYRIIKPWKKHLADHR